MTQDVAIAGRTDSRKRAVRPRDAATLILVDRTGNEPLVLMGRRSAAHSFMPGKWVFPGGRIAREDFGAPAAGELDDIVAGQLADRMMPRRARALAIAVIRETFEETGLLLAAPYTGQLPRGAWRKFLGHGVAPDLGALTFVARMITPPHRAKRFDTRFFMADATRLVSRKPVDTGELEEVHWFGLGEASTLDLALPTRMLIADVGRRMGDQSLPPLFRRFRTPRG